MSVRRIAQEISSALSFATVQQPRSPSGSVEGKRTTLTLVDDSFLRATWPATLLESFGRRLQNSADHEDAISHEREYSTKSFVVTRLDLFLSHSWHAPWLPKYLTLLLHTSFWPAFIAYLVVIVVGPYGLRVIGEYRCREDSMAACWKLRLVLHIIGALSFVITLFTWHNISLALNIRLRSIFFDRACIHQGDPKKKTEGIQSIGAILCKTRTLLIAWDATYFQRLWCAYELCSFTYSQPSGLIEVVPIQLSYFKVPMIIMSFLIHLISKCTRRLFGYTWESFVIDGLIFGLLRACFIPSIRRYMRERGRLAEQISKFSVRSAACFCCDNSHIHPVSGRPIPCDRRLIYSSINHWHGGGCQEAALDAFDLRVRQRLFLRARHGPVGISYTFTVALGVCQNGSLLAMIILFDDLDLPRALFWITLFTTMIFTDAAMSLGLSCYLAKHLAKEQSSCAVDCLLNIFIGLASESTSVFSDCCRVYVWHTYGRRQPCLAWALLCGHAALLILPLLHFFRGHVIGRLCCLNAAVKSSEVESLEAELACCDDGGQHCSSSDLPTVGRNS